MKVVMIVKKKHLVFFYSSATLALNATNQLLNTTIGICCCSQLTRRDGLRTQFAMLRNERCDQVFQN